LTFLLPLHTSREIGSKKRATPLFCTLSPLELKSPWCSVFFRGFSVTAPPLCNCLFPLLRNSRNVSLPSPAKTDDQPPSFAFRTSRKSFPSSQRACRLVSSPSLPLFAVMESFFPFHFSPSRPFMKVAACGPPF